MNSLIQIVIFVLDVGFVGCLGYKIYFIGDRCRENGNDHAIYEACRPNSWSTTGPEQTIEYIEQLINGVSE